MTLKFLKCTWHRVLFFSLLVITILVLIAAMLVNNYWSPILADKLKSTVANSTDNLYRANFDDAKLHVLEGRIVIYNITLKPDTNVYNALKKAHLAPNNLYELHVKKLVLKHIHPFNLYFNHKLDIGEIVLSAPMLKVSYQLNHAKDTVIKDKRTLYQQISKSLKMIHIGKVILNDVKLRYENHKGPKVAVSELQDLNLSAIDLLIDSASQFDKSRFLYCREMDAELNNYSGQSANGQYKYKAKQVTFSTRTSQLNAYDCSLIATRPPEEFFEHTYKDRFVSHLDSLQLNNFDFEVYNKYHTVSGSNLILTNGSLNIFGNPRKDPKADTINGVRNFPNVAIFRLPDIKIDTISLRSIDASYEEYNRKTKRAGIVRFDRTRGYFYNVTNDSAALTKNPTCKININTQFMNRGNLNVDFIFNLTDKLHSYSYKGRLGAMNLPAINPASKALASVAITSGRLNSLDFDMQGNSEVATGNVTLLYKDLKVQLLKADTTKLKMKHMTIASFFANALIIKHNNPDGDGLQPRSIPVTYQRPINFPFFKNVWHTLLAGIKPSFGLDDASQQNMKSRIEEHKQNVIERKQKKQIRIQKREQRRRLKAYKASLKNDSYAGR